MLKRLTNFKGMSGIQKKELRNNVLRWVAFICFISYFIIKTIREDNSLKSKHLYTVGIIIDKYKGIKQPLPILEFEYYLNNKKHIEGQAFNSDEYSIKIGQKYLVMFSPEDSDNSRILLGVPLADSIQAPYGGWQEPPFGLKGSEAIKW